MAFPSKDALSIWTPKYYEISESQNPNLIGGFPDWLRRCHKDTPGNWFYPETNMHPATRTKKISLPSSTAFQNQLKSLVGLRMWPELASLAMLWLSEQNTTRSAVVGNSAIEKNPTNPKPHHFYSFVIFLSVRIEILAVCISFWHRPSSPQCKYSHRTSGFSEVVSSECVNVAFQAVGDGERLSSRNPVLVCFI